jgi:predicted O-linked N-acetylglucosamine transferase (SPINDLY family)
LLTCTGQNFAGRVAASLLHAIGLPGMVTQSLADYEALALHLARDRNALVAIRARLVGNRKLSPLFDTDRFRRHIEAAFVTMWERAERGDAPAAFDVAAEVD